jgi:hypothetical protein
MGNFKGRQKNAQVEKNSETVEFWEKPWKGFDLQLFKNIGLRYALHASTEKLGFLCYPAGENGPASHDPHLASRWPSNAGGDAGENAGMKKPAGAGLCRGDWGAMAGAGLAAHSGLLGQHLRR